MTQAALTAVVCDDEPAIRSAVAEALIQAGCSLVVQTPSLAVLRSLLADTTPDVAVLDLAMTGLRGLDVVRELHESCPTCAVVVLTSFLSLREEALAAGARALVDSSDLRELQRLLTGLAVPSPRDSIELDAPATKADRPGR